MTNYIIFRLIRGRPCLGHPNFGKNLIEIRVSLYFHKPAAVRRTHILKHFVLKLYSLVIKHIKNHVVLRVGSFRRYTFLRSAFECPISTCGPFY